MVAVMPANTCDLRWVKWALREREQKSCDYTPANHGVDPDNLLGVIEGEEQQGLEVQHLHLHPGEGAQNTTVEQCHGCFAVGLRQRTENR